MKSRQAVIRKAEILVAPARERGLKCNCGICIYRNCCRSREGAWIEIATLPTLPRTLTVAPARERGLKLLLLYQITRVVLVAPARERGLKLAGIADIATAHGRSREGAWIEIRKLQNLTDKQRVAPARERGLKCAYSGRPIDGNAVAPARERGLKYIITSFTEQELGRSREGAWIEIAP